MAASTRVKASYYRSRLVAHGWALTRSRRTGAVRAKRGDVTYEARISAGWVGIFVKEDTPYYPFF